MELHDDKFELSLDDLRRRFADRGYPSSVVERAFSKVSKMSQSDALQHSTQNIKNVLPFTIVYNPSLPSISKTIHKYWDILNLSKNPGTTEIFQNYKPIVAFKRSKNLKDFLVRSDFNSDIRNAFSSQSSNSNRCSHCLHSNTGSSFSSHTTGETFQLHNDTNCKTKGVIYLVTCKKCQCQYVGQTRQQVSGRMNSHRYDICNFENPAFSSSVATHFNSSNHLINDFSFMPIDIVKDDFNRLCKEAFWIHKLQTLQPNGLNSKLLYNIN